MRLWWFSGESGLRAMIFAETEERASDLYAEVLIMSGAPSTKYWGREIAQDAVVPEHRDHYRDAVSRDPEGFGELDPRRGWRIISPAARIERL
jgi:hypothetical protein